MTLTTTSFFLTFPLKHVMLDTPRELVEIQHHGGPRLGRSHFTIHAPQIHVTTVSVKPVPPRRRQNKSHFDINLWYNVQG
jgi:hypothetical protein